MSSPRIRGIRGVRVSCNCPSKCKARCHWRLFSQQLMAACHGKQTKKLVFTIVTIYIYIHMHIHIHIHIHIHVCTCTIVTVENYSNWICTINIGNAVSQISMVLIPLLEGKLEWIQLLDIPKINKFLVATGFYDQCCKLYTYNIYIC